MNSADIAYLLEALQFTLVGVLLGFALRPVIFRAPGPPHYHRKAAHRDRF